MENRKSTIDILLLVEGAIKDRAVLRLGIVLPPMEIDLNELSNPWPYTLPKTDG